ncbi:serine/threonine-protein kinase [Sulfuracidifex metallicus]|uniref:serine/threonine-protein kinase n=1 Tax=Sulfuracidifex metallicus TaxID=47303 RepID=UPI00138E07DB|nr:serine/threonine-protein kinase [Sulfuracidifex metallicus]WOE51552.1 serine/threonine-protein kinase [Sulfuracidifex metallicus DSM 6482 = JCM 9184]
MIFNLIPGLVSFFLINQFAEIVNQIPSDVQLWNYILLVFIGTLAGILLMFDESKNFGRFLISLGVIFNIIFLILTLETPQKDSLAYNIVANIFFLSPFYFTTAIYTYKLHSRHVPPQLLKTNKPVHFSIYGLPQGAAIVVTVNGKQYSPSLYINGDYLLRVDEGVDKYYWSVPRQITVGNVTYTPDIESGVANPYKHVDVHYSISNPSPTPPPRYVTFIIRGLPPSQKATIKVENITYTADSSLVVTIEGRWVAKGVKVGNDVYSPFPHNGYARFGDTIVIDYRKVSVGSIKPRNLSNAPSMTLHPAGLTKWDPKVWVGKMLYVYEILDVIGEGGNGNILKGEYNGKEVAVKVLKLDRGDAEEYFKDWIKESSNLVTISSNPKVVKIYSVYVNEQVIEDILKGNLKLYKTYPPMIAMELMKGGTLADILLNDSFYYSSKWEKTVYRAIKDVAEALSFIHSQGYVHMDVKPQNIFLTERPSQPYELDKVEFKLGDLGSAVRINGKISQLTPLYSPPEVYDGVAKPYIDVFALGMTMYVVLTRKDNRPDLNEINEAFDCYVKNDVNCVKAKVSASKSKLSSWDPNVPDAVKPLIRSMLSPDPLKRPTAKEVVEYLNRIIT